MPHPYGFHNDQRCWPCYRRLSPSSKHQLGEYFWKINFMSCTGVWWLNNLLTHFMLFVSIKVQINPIRSALLRHCIYPQQHITTFITDYMLYYINALYSL